MDDPASPNKVKKKKLMEKSAEELRAVDNVACYRGEPLSTSAGPMHEPRHRADQRGVALEPGVDADE